MAAIYIYRERWPRIPILRALGTGNALDSIRLATPRDFRHRDLEHSIKQYYALPAGNRLSQQWTRASQQALGYSHGIHGLRHSFAQERVDEFIRLAMALERTSQLMGHYRPEEVLTYLPL